LFYYHHVSNTIVLRIFIVIQEKYKIKMKLKKLMKLKKILISSQVSKV